MVRVYNLYLHFGNNIVIKMVSTRSARQNDQLKPEYQALDRDRSKDGYKSSPEGGKRANSPQEAVLNQNMQTFYQISKTGYKVSIIGFPFKR